jgi:hypothetical protein
MQPASSTVNPPDYHTQQLAEPPAPIRHWPEEPLATPRPEGAFPFLPAVLWLLPGIITALVLMLLLGDMERRASHLIVFRTAGDSLATVRADGSRQQEVSFSRADRADFGDPQWSPAGERYAAVANQQLLVIARPLVITPTIISVPADNVMLPGRAWSADGDFIALLGREQTNQAVLFIADLAQERITPVALDPVDVAPAWNPARNELLVTSQTGNQTTTLQLVDTGGQIQPFTPKDQQINRFSGAWSPDGNQIAYVTSADRSARTGAIWVAQRDSEAPRNLVPTGENFAPIWAPSGDMLLFTRLVTETNDYDLYRVTLDGAVVTRIGRGSPFIRQPDLDPRAFIDWAPDGGLFFQAFDRQQRRVTVYAARRSDGQDATPVFIDSADYLTVRWSPTSRGLLIASDGERMRIVWLDQQRPATLFPSGRAPSWQPGP